MIGKVLGDRYEIRQRIGGGGMAVVYKAHDRLLNRSVAVKVLRPQFGQDEDFIRRFRREAQSAASLSHPNIVSIFDVGEEDDTYYIIMECIDGQTLKDIITERAPLDVSEAVDYAIQICDALDHAHQNRIIHRDIKPHNILISHHGRVKVTDFGIARAVSTNTITHTGSVIGSVHYFSPEQARGGMIEEKSDIYSLGIVLYEMLTGKVPFSGESPISVALKHLQENIVPPKKINPDIPQSVENVVLRALAKDPHKRYQSVREMEEDLKTCLLEERADEAPLHIEDVDDEATKILPAISEDMLDTKVNAMERQHLQEEMSGEEPHEGRIKQLSFWIRPVMWVSTLMLLVLVGVLGFNYARGILYVPDVSTPSVANLSQEAAVEKLKQNGLQADIKEIYHDVTKEGFVVRQQPAPGMVVKQNTQVLLYVSKGKKKVEMDDFRGLPYRKVQAELANQFAEIKVEKESSETVDAGKIISQEPAPGEMVIPGETTVVLTVSKGVDTIEMPNLIGKTEEEARATLLKYGLELAEDIQYGESYQPPGKVYWQFPYKPGDEVSPGSEVAIKISKGYPDDAKELYYPIKVEVERDQQVDVTIMVTDARGEDLTQIHETVSKTRVFRVHLVLAPGQNGYIKVYQDGSLLEKKMVSYRD
ncbi:MAG: Stk1 family PASTA domain-containing Ser/Thr kinase [Bacillaceae bacterium]|nr:Stk1 family PASTA domain-containing Ser/Thr kinase [Bacillaceae bacterium]